LGGWAVQEADPLVREAVARALAGPGVACLAAAQPSAGAERMLVGVHGLLGVASCPLRRAGRAGARCGHGVAGSACAPDTAGSGSRPAASGAGCVQPAAAAGRAGMSAQAILYVVRDPLAAELHRVHGCSDLTCVFWPEDGGGRFESLAWPGRLESAGLTPREADVLALLLARRTNQEIGAHLVLSASTVRAHCRAVLRKLGARDRRHLWALLPVAQW
jgi:DNA-binding CsgD family transcriptional regulator